jgi:hypothetical protein
LRSISGHFWNQSLQFSGWNHHLWTAGKGKEKTEQFSQNSIYVFSLAKKRMILAMTIGTVLPTAEYSPFSSRGVPHFWNDSTHGLKKRLHVSRASFSL